MATYVFKAMDLTGAKATGEVEADSKQVVSDQLKSRGLIVLDISAKHQSREINLDFFNKLKMTDLAIMTRQLATMVQSGMTILRALYVLEAQTENKILAEAIIAVRKDVEAGLSLSDALERHPKIFDPLFVSMTRAGETGGMLDEALVRVADQLEKADSLRRQVKSAMTYPAVVITFAGAVLLALVAFLVPVFIGVFKQFGGGLPPITKVTVMFSNALTGYWYVMFACVIAAVTAFRKWKRSEWGRPQWDRFRLRVPMKNATAPAIRKYHCPVTAFERPTVNLVMSGSSPPKSLKTPTNTGTMNAIRPIRTISANERTTIGYAIAPLTWRRSWSSFSSWSEMRSSDCSSTPPVSPARTIATYSGLKILGCLASASENARPDSMSSRTAPTVSLSFLFSIWSSST
jgi:hypothetical protein